MGTIGEKRMPDRKDKDKFIKPFIIMGVTVLLICLITCVFHIRNIRNNMEAEINQQLVDQLDVAGEILADDIGKTEQIVLTVAAEMGKKDAGRMSDTQIYSLLQKYKGIDNFQQITYIDSANMMYFDTGFCRDASERITDDLLAICEPQVYVANNFWAVSDEYLLLFVVPVMNGEQRIGFIVGAKSCRDILDGDSFSYLKKVGDVIVTDEKGTILDCNFIHMTDQTEYYDTVYDYMFKYWKISEQKIAEFDSMIASEEVPGGTIEIVNSTGTRYFYSFATSNVLPRLRIISVYTENVYTDVENNIIIGSVIFCFIIMLSMTILVFVAFRHNSSASQFITHLAFEDEITGGKNLNYFKEFATDMLCRYQGMPFMIHRMDVSNFRYINEAYGHVRADGLLKIIIEEAATIFYSKELCVRITADQFVLLTKNTQDLDERFFVFADKVNARALDIGIRYPIKFKRGVYQIKNKEYDILLMIDKANAARKTLSGEEKESVAYYSDKLVSDMRKIDRIESAMETALFNREFKMFIQPKWDIKEDKLYGGEALVRWMKADGTMVYPSDFVPVFEKNGFVEQLDLYMLEMACRLIRELLDTGRDIYPISVNQSRVLLHNPNYINRISELLKNYNIPKGYIELEITETVFFTEREKMLSILGELKQREVMLSMDDFGSGYSSLNMLKDFPFDVLKIDKEFFSESITSESSTWILRKIVEMAEGLGIRVICEGVETKEQVEMLKKIGCRYVQGYYYSKPIPAAEFVKLYCRESA